MRDNTRYVTMRITYDDAHPVPQPAVLADAIQAAVSKGALTPSGEEVVDVQTVRVSKYGERPSD